MEKKNQTVHYTLDSENHATYRNQTVTNIEVFDDGIAEGIWKGKHVAAFSLVTGEWYNI